MNSLSRQTRRPIPRRLPSIFAALATIGLLVPAGSALAAPFTFTPFDLFVENNSAVQGDQDPESVTLTGAPAGEVYNSYTVSIDWSPVTGGPWSSEALWLFANDSVTNGRTVTYANPGAALDSLDDSLPGSIHWKGFLDTPYTGGDPLHFWYDQAWFGTSADWSNITITLETLPPPPSPPSVLTHNFSNNIGFIQQGEVDWYSFEYTGGALAIDMLGSILVPDNDTVIGLYSNTGALVATGDDISANNRLSEITFVDGVLAPGTYYVAVAGFGTFLADGFTANSSSAYAGTYQLNINATPIAISVPEPGTLGLLGLPILLGAARFARRRNRVRATA